MTKLLSIISLILAIILFPPATLAVISNNAVPGDATYPIKRGLENVIFAAVSINPTTKAWFSQARSDRRFKELTVLITQGKQSGETLNELVEQTQVAASQIAQVNDQAQKQKLIQQLSESIEKYDLGLQQVSSPTQVNPAPAAPVALLPQATSTPQPTQTSAPVAQPTPRPASTSQPTPAHIVVPTPIPTPRPTPTPVPHPNDTDRQRQIEEARRRLDEIRRRLEEEQRRQREYSSQNEPPRQQIRQENRENTTGSSNSNNENKAQDKKGKH